MLNNKDILLYSDIDNIIKLLHSVEEFDLIFIDNINKYNKKSITDILKLLKNTGIIIFENTPNNKRLKNENWIYNSNGNIDMMHFHLFLSKNLKNRKIYETSSSRGTILTYIYPNPIIQNVYSKNKSVSNNLIDIYFNSKNPISTVFKNRKNLSHNISELCKYNNVLCISDNKHIINCFIKSKSNKKFICTENTYIESKILLNYRLLNITPEIIKIG